MTYLWHVGYLIVFVLGLLFYVRHSCMQEGFKSTSIPRDCPNLLVERNGQYFLHDTRKVSVPGINPVQFANLEDYTEFLDWQRSQGIQCPVLFLQSTITANGKEVYQTRPSVLDPQHGIPAVSSNNNNNDEVAGDDDDCDSSW